MTDYLIVNGVVDIAISIAKYNCFFYRVNCVKFKLIQDQCLVQFVMVLALRVQVQIV